MGRDKVIFTYLCLKCNTFCLGHFAFGHSVFLPWSALVGARGQFACPDGVAALSGGRLAVVDSDSHPTQEDSVTSGDSMPW